jgi:hypothetical protein
LVSGAMLTACGARTSQDELLGGPVVGVGGQVPAGCCSPSSVPGCESPTIEACVCGVDPICCNQAWDAACVAEVDSIGCGTCVSPSGGSGGSTGGSGGVSTGGLPPAGGSGGVTGGSGGVTGGTGGGTSSCCSPHNGTGCLDPMITACVCANDSFCCDTSWDSLCAVEANDCGAGCTGGSGGAPSGGSGGVSTGGVSTGGVSTGGVSTGGVATGGVGGITGDCCTTNMTAGCSNTAVEQCVCKIDSFCCATAWDSLCVQEADTYCGAGCGAGGSGGSSTGGASTGGTGGVGVGECMNSLPASCNSCACTKCLGSYNDCLMNGNCVPFAVCAYLNSCPCQ